MGGGGGAGGLQPKGQTKGQSVWLGEVAQQSFQAQADVPFGPSQNDSLT